MVELKCSICIFLPGLGIGDERAILPAQTVINGQAVCLDHTGLVEGGAHSQALQMMRLMAPKEAGR